MTEQPETAAPTSMATSSPESPAGRGLFLAMEGGDGAGKSTQVRLLREWLEGLGHLVCVTREPGGTEVGQAIRQVVLHGGHVAPRAEALLFAADRAQHVQTLVRPALARGEVVVTDRYMDSSIAYQGAGRDLDAAEVHQLSMWATGGLLPALTVVLDVSPGTGRRRRGDLHDRLESEPEAFHARVRAHFLALADADPDRYLVLDADRPPEQVHAAVRARVGDLVGVRR